MSSVFSLVASSVFIMMFMCLVVSSAARFKELPKQCVFSMCTMLPFFDSYTRPLWHTAVTIIGLSPAFFNC